MMPLEKQVCALEYSKRLWELGVRQESYFYHIIGKRAGIDKVLQHVIEPSSIKDSMLFNRRVLPGLEVEAYPAYTVAELGEMLPDEFIVNDEEVNLFCYFYLGPKRVAYGYEGKGKASFHEEQDSTEANARTKMLIHLLENNLIPKPEVKDAEV
jgi:hypothetical protein